MAARSDDDATEYGSTGRRDVTGLGLALLNRLAGAPIVHRLGLRGPVRAAVFQATRAGFRTTAAAGRTWQAGQRLGRPARSPSAVEPDLLDLTPTDDQRMIVETVTEFAAEQVRPAAAAADEACATPPAIFATAAELGIALLGVPAELGGVATERATTTNVLVAEALGHGDLGIAVACLAPSAVGNALALWGDADQQSIYLPAFTGDNVPAAALAVLEPRPLFDPFALRTTARRTSDGFVLDGVKSLVPGAATAELFVVAAELEGRGPALFLVESADVTGVEAEPAMGLRAAGMGRLVFEKVRVPAKALLGGAQPDVYADCVRLSRLGWCALAVGTGRAVLDYVIPYVNERVAFGEPVSHRQGVAFTVADMAIELEGMRLLTYRAAGRAAAGSSFAREVGLARKLCVDKGMFIGSAGVQMLGGHGYVKEHPVERWYRDLRAIGVAEGIVLV
ncbi:MAG TPA: acyl-CoA dehydrogenase family protein [Pseudonocardiaceae bacterium]|nr:acyl-CoA dehydrogenase family protein [Pseudonocardiaceae bacterium]